MYTIQSEGTRFWTGRTEEIQVILGGVVPEIRIYVFSLNGDFQEMKSYSIEDLLGVSETRNDKLFLMIEEAAHRVMNILCIQEGTIKVKGYSDEVFSLAELTDELQDFIDNRENFEDDEVDELEEIYRDWKAGQYYALTWVEEYWMTAEGELDVS